MSRIRILSEHLANQIAAGEVVERPASVVKELVENSLDAGAADISVQVEGGGTRLIRVVDNGEGMGEDDVLLSIERHATSKIDDNSRLDAITTLGFRGEALPSIGSVSRLTLLSRPQHKATGTRAEMRYGTLHAVHEDGCAQGTVVEVRGLFGNVPARRKFLKSARTELYHIEEVLRNQSLAHMGTGFLLRVDGRTVLDLQPVENPEQRIRDVFRYHGKLIIIHAEDNEEPVRISGFLLQPEVSASITNKLRTLVNGRPVRDRMVRHAVVEGLHGFLMKGHSPSGVLFLDLPAEQIDVNVHPAKQEIRFRRSPDVHRCIVRAVRSALRAYQEEARSDIFVLAPPSPTVRQEEQRTVAGKSGGRPTLPPGRRQFPADSFSSPGSRSTEAGAQTGEPLAGFDVPPSPPSVLHGRGKEGLPDFSGLVVVGQLFNLYLLCERKGQLVVIDQHAAHERILYQQLRSAYGQRSIPRQSLMFPVPVEMSMEQADILERHGRDIAELGFILQHFGEETWVIKAVPALVASVDPADLLFETLDKIASAGNDKSSGIAARIDNLLSSMACKAAIKAGDRLAPEEMLKLLEQMQASEFFSHCPHGRPVVKVFSEKDIEKWFNRG
ncbi:MAG: DNA mismatch repair endonuclease MutL [Desulfobulbaceae bacterium]|nr:DNA mismatch repair endonuclease MutL [Desulfobulbaceae bacterium]